MINNNAGIYQAKENIYKLIKMDFTTINQPNLNSPFSKSKIIIRVIRQSARRAITMIEGLDDDLDLKRICKYMKRFFNTNGCVIDDKVIQLQGYFKDEAREWLVKEEVLTESEANERIVLRGM